MTIGTNAQNSGDRRFVQRDYPSPLYKSELEQHEQVVDEYREEIFESLLETSKSNIPNAEAFVQQPYMTPAIRAKLLDFLIKMSFRLKALPFVFYKAVKLFDRYCCKRAVILDQTQLIISTCLWIAAKFRGGNNHFVNLGKMDALESVKTINDIGYGTGGKFKGPTERYRMPKLHEFVRLCGSKCNYTPHQFKQMELHILSTLDWSFNDPSIDDFIVSSREYNVLKPNELFHIKRFVAYCSLYSTELMDANIVDVSTVVMDLINEMLNLNETGYYHDRLHRSFNRNTYKRIKKNLIKAVLNASDSIFDMFNTRGPERLHQAVASVYASSSCLSLSCSTTASMLERDTYLLARKYKQPFFGDTNLTPLPSPTKVSSPTTNISSLSLSSTNSLNTSYSCSPPPRFGVYCERMYPLISVVQNDGRMSPVSLNVIH